MKISNIGLAALLFAAAPLAMSSTTLAQTTPGSSAPSGSVAQSADPSGSTNSIATPSANVPSASTDTLDRASTPDASADVSKNKSMPRATSTTTTSPRDNEATESRESIRDGMPKGKVSQNDMTKKGDMSRHGSIRDRNAATIDNDRAGGKKMDRAERRSNRSASHRSTHHRRDWARRHQGRRWVGIGPTVGFGFGAPYSENRYYDDSFAFSPRSGDVAYCSAHFRSYDPASGTYLGYDGFRHSCP